MALSSGAETWAECERAGGERVAQRKAMRIKGFTAYVDGIGWGFVEQC